MSDPPQLEWTPDLYPPEEQVPLREALAIMRRSELMLATGWTPEQLDEQDADEIERLEAYMQVKAGLRRERDEVEQARRRRGGH